MKMNNILLPFDGSEYSLNAARYALDLAKVTQSQVTIVYCDEWRMNFTEVPDSLIEQIKINRKEEAGILLKGAEGIFENQGVKYTAETISGSAGEILTRLAKSKDYDLIVMGSHGHSDISGLFLGSVTHKVLNKIYCPILIVP